ncbi:MULTISPECIES: radical SAM protein [Clostridium]|uniref:radical SAM protein n=1 Tax=Clostridium TaxID=1485 RepID=UPI0025807345|nr:MULTISPECIES: radical SAM protein [Clostridium]MBS4840272.1 radical SAM protein [Clostridium sp.]MDU1401659.1 radical SAM protein [Clostridium sp.]MDU1601459.1 radical SAM protein [Clostridium sp.]MDU2894612.1 radical SAM protein [Clostridium sp.]MDU3006477.1 radical SAM protein [Clostridium sp.]
MNLSIEKLADDWMNTKSIIVYGLGVIALKCIDKLMEDFEIPFIIDNNKAKSEGNYKGIPIITQNEAKEKINGRKIIVPCTIGVYKDISENLIKDGFKEYEDFCLFDLFVAQWYLNNKSRICLTEIHTSITTRCTLKCKNCNMFMPHYDNHYEMSFKEFKEEMDLFFSKVDYVFSLGILGGEPFLNKDLYKMIEYLKDNYYDRIGEITIISNGTILPSNNLHILKLSKIKIHISDYSKSVDYSERLNKVIKIFKENDINFRVNSSLVWCDFGFPEKPFNYSDNKIREHMMMCFPIFRGYNDKKFYFCHVAWSAEKCGKFQLNENDYYEMEKVNKSDKKSMYEFLNYNLGGALDWRLSLCKVCGGCGSDNKKYVEPALQVKG